MFAEYSLASMIATVFLLVFSLIYSYFRLRYLGFGFTGWLDRCIDYEERRQTEIGKQAHRPLLIRHSSGLYQILWLLGPLSLNGAVLLLLYGLGSYAWAPSIAVPLVLAELLLGEWMLRHRSRMYQADFDEYMRLTHGDNRWFDGTIVDQRQLADIQSGGRIVMVSRVVSGKVESLQLFVSYDTDRRYPIREVETERVRIFYHVFGPPNLYRYIVVDGELLGFQTKLKKSEPGLSHEEFEARMATRCK
jgi:hypothetical protein